MAGNDEDVAQAAQPADPDAPFNALEAQMTAMATQMQQLIDAFQQQQAPAQGNQQQVLAQGNQQQVLAQVNQQNQQPPPPAPECRQSATETFDEFNIRLRNLAGPAALFPTCIDQQLATAIMTGIRDTATKQKRLA